MMYKLILTLAVLVVVVNSQNQNVTTFGTKSYEGVILRPDDYVYANKLQNARNIKAYDDQMNEFRRRYNERVGTIDTLLDMLVDAIEQNEARLYPFELLSDESKKCVRAQRPNLPTVAATRTSINSCISTATSGLNSLLSYPLATRNSAQTYYTNTYDKGITTCDTKYNALTLNYTQCVTSLTTASNTYTASNQKTFATQMDTAECSANANIKRALDCTFSIQNRTIASMGQSNTLIDNCLSGKNNCPPCSEGYGCPDIYYVKRQEVDYTNSTMPNPFYGRNGNSSCLMLEIYDYNRIFT